VDVDRRAVVGVDEGADVELRGPVGAHRQPVGAEVGDGPVHLRALHGAAVDAHDDAGAVRAVRDDDRGVEGRVHVEQELHVQ